MSSSKDLVALYVWRGSQLSKAIGKYFCFFNQLSVGGVMVSIVAFQAVDPGSTPGQRTFHNNFFHFLNCTYMYLFLKEISS